MFDLKLIENERLLLRPITLDDTRLIVTWRNKPSVMRNFVFSEQFTEEMHEHWFNTKIRSGEVVQYIIVDKAEQLPIGSVYYRDIDCNNRSAEYGIFIGVDSARGKGYGTEVTKMFTDFGFETLKLHRIMLRVFSDNHPAQKAYIKAGFIVEGEFRDMIYKDGDYRSMIFMAKINPK